MSLNTRRFPLVADNEPVVTAAPEMDLYEETDFISKIKGNYQDRFFTHSPSVQDSKMFVRANDVPLEKKVEVNQGKSYAQAMREASKEDIKRKRQTYIQQELHLPKTVTGKKSLASEKVTITRAKSSISKNPSLRELADSLRQDTYILAELPTLYKEPQNVATSKTPQKNNYDFLRKSQIYNPEKLRENQERQLAQELNLMRFED